MPVVDHQKLRSLARSLFIAAGCSAEEAGIVADGLVEANLKGHDSHGVVSLPGYIGWLRSGGTQTGKPPTVLRDDGAFLVLDGNRGLGQVAGRRAMELGIARARSQGVAIVALRNSGHMGRIGAYGEQCAQAGFVSLHFVNVVGEQPNVAPHGSRQARFGTNPFCFAAPASARHAPTAARNAPTSSRHAPTSSRHANVILDGATSKVAWGKLKIAFNKGEQAGEGLMIDAAGRPSRDPATVVASDATGALVIFGEHKGSGIALFCELLAGALTGGDTIQPANTRNGVTINNMLSILIDPARTAPDGRFAREADAVLDYVLSALPLDEDAPVQLPGDPERRAMAKRLKDGIPIDDQTWLALTSLARDLNVAIS